MVTRKALSILCIVVLGIFPLIGRLSGNATPVEFTIAASAGEGGRIEPPGTVSVQRGKEKTFTITPNEGYEIEDVEVDGSSVGAIPSYTFQNVTKDHTILATFRRSSPLRIVWNFEDATKRAEAVASPPRLSRYTPDECTLPRAEASGIEINLTGAAWPNRYNQQQAYGFSQGSSGPGTYAAHSDNWEDGADTKYWQVTISTKGYKSIKLSSKQRSSPRGPRDFKVQYSTDGTTWNDIPGAGLTVCEDFTMGVLDQVPLPSECENQPTLYLRWVMTSNISVNGQTVLDQGTNRIDDIVVEGEPM